MNNIVFEIVNYIAEAQEGADKMSNDLRKRAEDNWRKSFELPRKAKKLLRKDAKLDFWFASMNDKFTQDLINL
jgi:hypothetical protein